MSYLYHRFLYRPHMRIIHFLGWHQFVTYGPLSPGNGYVTRCEWCGKHKALDGTD